MKLALIIFLVSLDQFTKIQVRTLSDPIVITDFFRFHFVENEGIAFSLPVGQWVVIPITIVVLGWLGWELWQSSKFEVLNSKNNKRLKTNDYGLWTHYAYIFLFAGALGNLIDRVFFGKVTDFLSFWNFAIFNLADVWINIGILCFVIGIFDEVLRKKDT